MNFDTGPANLIYNFTFLYQFNKVQFFFNFAKNLNKNLA